MAPAKVDPNIRAHRDWLNLVQPTGLVVSAPALVRAGAILDRNDAEGQRLLRAAVEEQTLDAQEEPVPVLPDFRAFAEKVLGWSFAPKGYAGTAESPIPSELETPGDEEETLRPGFAVRERDPKEGATPWQLLVQVLPPGEALDGAAHSRLERLLRAVRVPAGLLFNGHALRLLSAPYGESSGWLDFRVADMVKTDGRPISAALRLLLGEMRLLSLPRTERLAALLDDSRKFQNEVSERLAEQVLHALYELLRGFQAAHDASRGELLRAPLANQPDEVYRALLTVILRLVFLLYAEERDMLPKDGTFQRFYSLAGLYERLREDAALFPDTLNQRYGAWPQLLVLFWMIYDGAVCGAMRLPRRHGGLFDPERFPFLEGRPSVGTRQRHERIEPPLVPDSTIYRVLEKLLVLDGERISYRTLDVAHIGSVYETMMGFRLETATGRSVAVKPQKRQGAPVAVDLESLLREPAARREAWLQERTGRKLTDRIKKAAKAATVLEDLHAALLPVIDLEATPDLVAQGAVVLQPSEERRRSGSHYTRRELTEPIVATTLAPIFARLRGPEDRPPRPEQILDLKVCDPAMGSGAFLVEACRQLGDALLEAWRAHGGVPAIPPDEKEEVFAWRRVAQRCIYGIDRNPMAVDLARVSLWLLTLAKDHPLTFVDHALRHGDSLVGLSRRQIEAFHWDESKPPILRGLGIRDSLDAVVALRRRIRGADESVPDWDLRDWWNEANSELKKVRIFGDLVLASFFEGDSPKDRESKRSGYVSEVLNGAAEKHRDWLNEWRYANLPLAPFHWEIEFPEVFERAKAGFDAIVGNPPFMGGKDISGTLVRNYLDWLTSSYERSGGQADLVSYFFRRAFAKLAPGGCFGLIATNTIAQGDTRRAGLGAILSFGGTIYSAIRRLRWPGAAAVVVSIVHVTKGEKPAICLLDWRPVQQITAYLFHSGGSDDPKRLAENNRLAFTGGYPYGAGFTFDDENEEATPVSVMKELLRGNPQNAERIFPYLGGAEFLNDPRQRHRRFVIDFGDVTEEEARNWPDLYRIVESKVKPERAKLTDNADGRKRKKYWWQWGRSTPTLDEARAGLSRVLMHPFYSANLAFAFVGSEVIVASPHPVFAVESLSAFSSLQCSVHETWVRFFGSSFKDDLRYTASDCFETYPFPENWKTHPDLEAVGKAYYEFRAALMVRNNEGLTKTYNRFHDPNEREPDILNLRELHAAMDRAVLDAYNWKDIPTACEFLLDYESGDDEGSNKKKPWRYRWPDDVRDEVLARLLELNAKRAKEEARSGAAAAKPRGRKAAKAAIRTSETRDLFS